MASPDASCTTCRACSVWPDRTAPVLLTGAVPVLGSYEMGAHTLARGGAATSAHAYTRARTRAHPQVCARAHPRACAQVCAQRCSRACAQVAGRQRRPTSSLAVEPHGSHPLLRLTFAPAPRCARRTASKTVALHHAPVAVSMPSRSSSISTGAFPCRRFSPLFLLFSFSSAVCPLRAPGPPDPCSIRSPLSSLHLLVVVPESRPDSSQPLPQILTMGWGCGWELAEKDSWLHQAKSAAAIRCIGRTDRGTDRAGIRGHVPPRSLPSPTRPDAAGARAWRASLMRHPTVRAAMREWQSTESRETAREVTVLRWGAARSAVGDDVAHGRQARRRAAERAAFVAAVAGPQGRCPTRTPRSLRPLSRVRR
jgi:hypothetical protein